MSLSVSSVSSVPPTSLQVAIRAAQSPADPAPPDDDTAPQAADAPGQTLDITT